MNKKFKRGYVTLNRILIGSYYRLILLTILLISFNNYCQAQQKKPVTESDYGLWATMYTDKLSEKAKWVSYWMNYDESPDTLFIKHVEGKKTYSIANASTGKFCKEHKFASLDHNSLLHLLDLNNGFVQTIAHVKSFSFSANGKYLITLEVDQGKKAVCIRNMEGQVLERLDEAEHFRMNNEEDSMVCINKEGGINKVQLITFGNKIVKSIITEDIHGFFSHLVWSDSDQSVTFFKEDKEDKSPIIYYYTLKEKKINQFDKDKIVGFPADYYLLTGYASGLTLSADDKKVFFSISKKPALSEKFDGVQIWNGNDAVVYPERRYVGDAEFNTRFVVWRPESGTFMPVTNDDKPFGFLNGNNDFALTYSSNDLGPQYKLSPNVNYFVTNLETGKRTLLLENQSTELRKTSLSPKGKYFAYFSDNNWWVYDFKKQIKINISNKNFIQSINEEDLSWKDIYGVAAWGPNDDYLLLHDQYDVWKVTFDGSNPIRLTNGRERKIAFRVVPLNKKKYSTFSGNVDQAVDISRELLLSGAGENKTGYFLRLPSGSIRTLIFDHSRNTKIFKATKSNLFVFQSQKHDSPPALILSNGITGKQTQIFQSNEHHYNYLWGKQEIINYRNSKNVPLKGILYYPAEYNSSKKYPMVVFIYEKQTYLKDYYFNPSIYNPAGVNVATLTAQGYFVLLPDIEYEIGNPGISATDCVLAATNKVINSELVYRDKIALMGQSFGGYETNFIITQTNLFKTAISSASVFDLTSWYLSIGAIAGRPEIWRFESQQWRMGKSLFEDRKGYERNSPATWVENTSTPLLLWTGETDTQIDPKQSIAFYLALRRLHKKEIMLVYPNENHSLVLQKSQKDLYFRIKDWLNYFLKDQTPANWISDGIK